MARLALARYPAQILIFFKLKMASPAILFLGICRGIVTADVLEQGLTRRAIALGSLKGLIGTKDMREFYTSSTPYDEGKSLRLVVLVLLGLR